MPKAFEWVGVGGKEEGLHMRRERPWHLVSVFLMICGMRDPTTSVERVSQESIIYGDNIGRKM